MGIRISWQKFSNSVWVGTKEGHTTPTHIMKHIDKRMKKRK